MRGFPMHSVKLDDDRADACFQDLEMSDEAIAVLAKQAPRDMLRPLGICDTDIPEAMKAVLQSKPLRFGMNSQQELDGFLSAALTLMHDVPVQNIYAGCGGGRLISNSS